MDADDWTDEGWNRFAQVYLADHPSESMLRLLKEAWLHGARCALDRAQETIGDNFKDAALR
jgi:hypothetical protein